MKIDLKKSGGDFLSVNTFPPKLKYLLLDLSDLFLPFRPQQEFHLSGIYS